MYKRLGPNKSQFLISELKTWVVKMTIVILRFFEFSFTGNVQTMLYYQKYISKVIIL